MSPSGDETTLPVQWCEVNDPLEVSNSVPTCATPENAFPVSGSETLIELLVVLVAEVEAEVVVVLEVEADGELEAEADRVAAEALGLLEALTVPELASATRPSTFA